MGQDSVDATLHCYWSLTIWSQWLTHDIQAWSSRSWLIYRMHTCLGSWAGSLIWSRTPCHRMQTSYVSRSSGFLFRVAPSACLMLLACAVGQPRNQSAKPLWCVGDPSALSKATISCQMKSQGKRQALYHFLRRRTSRVICESICVCACMSVSIGINLCNWDKMSKVL